MKHTNAVLRAISAATIGLCIAQPALAQWPGAVYRNGGYSGESIENPASAQRVASGRLDWGSLSRYEPASTRTAAAAPVEPYYGYVGTSYIVQAPSGRLDWGSLSQ